MTAGFAPPATPHDLARTAVNMVAAAIAVTAGRMHLEASDAAVDVLRRDDPAAVGHFWAELGRQVATTLLRGSDQVVAIYEEQAVPESEEMAPEEPSLNRPLRLYVQAHIETAALRTLVGALDHALAAAITLRLDHIVTRSVDALIITGEHDRLLSRGVRGYRPAPILVAARRSHEERP